MNVLKNEDHLNCKGDGCMIKYQCFRFMKKENPLHSFKIDSPISYDNSTGIFVCPMYLELRDEDETEPHYN